MTDYTDTTTRPTSSSDEAASPTARKRGRPAKAATAAPKAKATPKAAAKPARAAQRSLNAAVTPILQQLAEMNDAGTMTPEIAAAGLRFCIALMGGHDHV